MATKTLDRKPAKTPPPKQPSRQPPGDTVWVQYHPWMEGLVGHLTSWAIHALVIGFFLLCFLGILGFVKPQTSLPVRPVTLLDAGGGGNPNGSDNNDGGDHAPPQEGAKSEQDNPGNSTNPTPSDRPPLPTDIAKQVDEDFSKEDARQIKEGPAVAQTFAELDKDFRDKMRDGINPSRGKAGPGTGTGEGPGHGTGTGPGSGPGTGKMELNEREKRMLRWTMSFRTDRALHGADYLQQLQGLGAILGLQFGPDSYKVVDLSKHPYQMEDRDLSSIQRIWWTVEPASIPDLMAAMRLPGQPGRVVAFVPPELEDDLAKKELDYRKLKDNDIYETIFDVIPSGGRYDVRVRSQTSKAEAARMGKP